MSKFNFIDRVNNYSVQEFVEFLKINELPEFETIAIKKSIDGHTFLNLAEFEINNWRPLLNTYQAKKFWSFLNKLHHNPEIFTYLHSKPPIPEKPSISRARLENLSQNSSFLHSLRNAVQNRVAAKSRADDTQKPPAQTQDRREIAPPPRPPVFKRPPAIYPTSEPEDHDDDDEDMIYTVPDDEEEEAKSRISQFSQNAQKPLPELPSAFSEQLNLYDDPDQSKPQAGNEEVGQRKQFRLEHHYARQRERERELAAQALQTVSSKKTIQSSPLPPVPVRDVSPRPRRTPEKVNTLPRPPIILPKVEVPKLPDSPDPPLQKPMEQESYYRYTDRKGAEQLLSEPYADGTYLVRPSRSYHGTLSVKHDNRVYHIGIKKVPGNMLEMESSGLNLKFSTLNEIIDYFKINPLSVRNKLNEIIDIYLDRTLPADRT